MSIFQFNHHNKPGILAIIDYLIWGFLLFLAIFFSWIFLFVYKHLYMIILQESAIIDLKSNLVITKVSKSKFDDVVKNFEQKHMPLVNINFDKLENPFASNTENKK